MIKASYKTKEAYKKYIQAVTLTGATVQKVDLGVFCFHISPVVFLMLMLDSLAPSTCLIFGGDPSEYDPILNNKHIKCMMVCDVKLEKHPDGLGLMGEPLLIAKILKTMFNI
jgi:hypothetical protein